MVPNLIKANASWALPGFTSKGAFLHQITKDWQISGVFTGVSGGAYALGYSYKTNGANVNITGSPDFAGRVVLGSNVGGGCGKQLSEFNASAVTGPTYGSTGMESGINYMRGCFNKSVDMSIVRKIRFWKFTESRSFQFRADIFNTLNIANITARSSTAQFNNPQSMTLQNPEFDASGNILPTKSLPQNAGFGAATGAAAMRTLQLELRIAF